MSYTKAELKQLFRIIAKTKKRRSSTTWTRSLNLLKSEFFKALG
jgi:hypothetical protein